MLVRSLESRVLQNCFKNIYSYQILPSTQIGSVILAVDGLNVSGLSLDAIRSRISGAPDSRVSIKYLALEGYERDVVLTRGSSSVVGANSGNEKKKEHLHGTIRRALLHFQGQDLGQ